MSYWNRDIDEPVKCWHDKCFPVPLVPAWRAVTCKRANAPTNLDDYMAQCMPNQSAGDPDWENHRDRMRLMMTPEGYAWDRRYGSNCHKCGLPA